jgi:hypothetical protein
MKAMKSFSPYSFVLVTALSRYQVENYLLCIATLACHRFLGQAVPHCSDDEHSLTGMFSCRHLKK